MTAEVDPAGGRRQTVYQSSLMSALLAGVYDGELTVRELLQHGDFGLGTFNALDGEMIIIDGVCHRLRSDGGATPAAPDARTPFAVVTRFVPSFTAELPPDLVRDQVVDVIRRLTPSENYLYAVRVTGHFAWVRTRTVRRQDRPYRPLVEVTKGEPVQRFDDLDGVVAGIPHSSVRTGYRRPRRTRALHRRRASARRARAGFQDHQGDASSCARPPICTWRCRCPTRSAGRTWILPTSSSRFGRRRTTADPGLVLS